MTEPILFVVDDDPETLTCVATALARRFGADYRVLTDSSSRHLDPGRRADRTAPLRSGAARSGR